MRLRTGPGCILVALFLWLIAVFPAPSFPQSATGTLRGQVTDPSGSAVPGASVLVTPAGGQLISVTTNRDGVYEVKNLAPGTYDVQVLAKGFAIFESKEVTVTANQIQKLDVPLVIEQQKQKVVVESEASNVDVNPENNVGAIVLKQDDLKALSDDPDELQSDLEALAGPSAGPNGGQIYIDGFTAGQLPPKSASAKSASIKILFLPNTTSSATAASKFSPSPEPTSGTAARNCKATIPLLIPKIRLQAAPSRVITPLSSTAISAALSARKRLSSSAASIATSTTSP